MAAKKTGLGSKGRGIENLISTQFEDFQKPVQKNPFFSGNVAEIDINHIEPNRSQPRKQFSEGALEELAQSLRQYGMIEPVVVRQKEDYYELIAGERRWRAAKIAGLKIIPAVLKDWDSAEAFEVALVENLQRENLNPMEEAAGYARLAEEFGLSQEEIAAKVGKSRPAVANAMRLLSLDERVKEFVSTGKLSAGHARTLLPLDGDKQFDLAERIMEDGLSVRQAEAAVKAFLTPAKEKKPSAAFDRSHYRQIEQDLHQLFSTKVKLSSTKNKGKIEIEYYSDDDLDRLIGILKRLEG